jgi:hypothetical protein
MGNSCQPFAPLFNFLSSVEIVRWPQHGDRPGENAPGPTMGRLIREIRISRWITKGPRCFCQSGCRRVRQECNGCVRAATGSHIRSYGHIFARGMPDRPRVVSSACGPRRDGAARGLRSSRHFGKKDRCLAESPVPLFESLSNGTGAPSHRRKLALVVVAKRREFSFCRSFFFDVFRPDAPLRHFCCVRLVPAQTLHDAVTVKENRPRPPSRRGQLVASPG